MLGFRFTNEFKKDLKLIEKRRYETDELFDILAKIIWEEPLPERCREHSLSGNYSGFTECHVKNDWGLIYYFCKEGVVFTRTGTHSDLL
jgi:mRNA interferase YafQ